MREHRKLPRLGQMAVPGAVHRQRTQQDAPLAVHLFDQPRIIVGEPSDRPPLAVRRSSRFPPARVTGLTERAVWLLAKQLQGGMQEPFDVEDDSLFGLCRFN